MARTFRNIGLNNVSQAKMAGIMFEQNNRRFANKKVARYLDRNFNQMTDGDVKTLKSIGLIKSNSSKKHQTIKNNNRIPYE
tara:strand:+ start:1168 stop:1410 length:243 start_codon:yes stop_codon:yes gene_type:complete